MCDLQAADLYGLSIELYVAADFCFSSRHLLDVPAAFLFLPKYCVVSKGIRLGQHMRIGEILLESGLIDAKQLADALYYAKAKALPLGRCLHILRAINEDNLRKGLEAQKLIRQGTPPAIALSALQMASARNIAVHQALKDRLAREGPESTFSMPTTAPLAIVFDSPPGDTVAVDRKTVQTKTPAELLTEADQFMLDDRCKDAEALYMQARELLVKASGKQTDESTAVSLKIANLYLATDRHSEAEELYKSLLDYQSKTKGDAHLSVARAYEDLGDLYEVQGKKDSAHQFHRSALEVVRKSSEFDIAVAGRILRKLVDTAPAGEEPIKRIGELCTESGLLPLPTVQSALQKAKQQNKPMGSILREENLLDSVQLESLLHAQLLVKEGLAKPSLAVQALQVSLQAKVSLRQLCEAGRLVPAEADSEEYRQIVLEQDRLLAAETSLGVNHLEVAQIACKLAKLQHSRKDRLSAEFLLKRAINIFEKAEGGGKQDLLSALQSLATVLIETDRFSAAQPYLLKALEIRQKSGRTAGPESLLCLRMLGQVEGAQFSYASACSFYKSAIALFDEIPEGTPNMEWHWMLDAARCFAEAGLIQDAEKLAQRFVFLAQREFGPAEPETAHWMSCSADYAILAGNVAKGEAQLHFALQILERSLDSTEPVRVIKEKLAKLPKTS